MNGEMGQVRTTLVENLKELHLPAMRVCFEETARARKRKRSVMSSTCWSWRSESVKSGGGSGSESYSRNPVYLWRSPWQTSTASVCR